MTDHCYYDRWKVIHRCPEAKQLYDKVFEAHQWWVNYESLENEKAVDDCWQDYQEHIKSCTTLEGVKQ